MFHVKHHLRCVRIGSRMFHVKHDPTPLESNAVRARLAPLGLTLTDRQTDLLVRHAELVLEHNQYLNLTRITEPENVIDLHIVDSLSFLPHVETPGGRWLDIGSGAGYPGIPLAILGYDVTLCESVKKKAAFLATAVSDLGLATEVLPLRAEEVAVANPGSFDVVIARAVSSLPALVELASPLLRPGGCLIAMKGRPEAAERENVLAACAIVGMKPKQETDYQLPNGDLRSVFVYTRTGKARVSLPRRPGMAQRQPFGTKSA